MGGHKFPTDEEESGIEDSTINTDMALAKAIDFMNSKKDIDIKTDIPNNAVPFIVALAMEQNFTNSKSMTDFTENIKILRISRDRKSREEIIELAKTRREEMMGNTGVFARAVNWMRGGGNV